MADELDERARSLLLAYKRDAGPSAAATERLLASVRRSAAQAQGAEVLPLRRRSRHWVGVAVVGLVAAAVALAIRMSPRRADADAGQGGSAAALQAGDMPASESVRPRTRRVEAHEAATTILAPAPGPASEPSIQRPRPGKIGRAAEANSAGAPAVEPLAQELASMRAVNDALAVGSSAEALARLDDYERRFPAGALREEAAALRAVALCAGGGPAGADAGAAFLAAHPGSLSAERVRRDCGVR